MERTPGERTLTVFADYTCPYSYLAETQLAPCRAAGLVMEPAAFELHPAGVPLAGPDASDWHDRVLPLARELGVDLRRPGQPVRTRKAHELVAFARSQGRAPDVHTALYEAWWQEGRDIGRIDVLVELAEAAGLDRTLSRIALDIDQWAARVEEDLLLARQLRLDVVPAYLLVERRPDTAPRAALRTGLLRRDELEKWTSAHDVREDDGGTDP